MPTSRAMGKTLPQSEPLQHPRKGQGPSQGDGPRSQQTFEFNTPAAHSQVITDITRDVAEQFFGHDALAADMGISRQLMRLKLHRGIDSHGDVVKMHVDVIGHLWMDPEARWTWANQIALAVGAKPLEPARSPDAEERARVLAGALSPEVKRALEKANGLPRGSLG